MVSPQSNRTPPTASTTTTLKPGAEAAAGTPGTGENICPVCHGRGNVSGSVCANGAGTGRITTGIGGA